MAFQAGDPLHKLSARWLNRVDALVRSTESSKDSLAIGELENQWADNQIIRVKNASGTAVKQFGVLKVVGPLISPADNEAEFRNAMVAEGATPSSGDTKLCITLEPLAPGAIGRAVVGGLVPVRVQAVSEATEPYVAGAASLEWMQYSSGGLPVVWNGPRNTETNIRWAWVFLGPPATAVDKGGESTGAFSFLGCNLARCIDADSTWAMDTEGNCGRVPRVWELRFHNLENPSACRIFFPPPAALPDMQYYYTGWLMYQTPEGSGVWKSAVINCDCPLAPGENVCGTATWQWRSNVVGSAVYEWIPNPPPNLFCQGNWSLASDPCAQGYSSPPSSPPTPVEGTTLCDPQPSVSVPCVDPLITPGWQLVSGCSCGIAPPPSYEGTEDGETAVTTCDSTGYEVPTAQYQWWFDEATWTLKLVELPGRVVYEWEVPHPKTKCCLCTNTLVLKTCHKPRECIKPPQVACINPAWIEVCPEWGESVQIEIDGFGGVTDNTSPIQDFHCADLDGIYLATSPRPAECPGGGAETCYVWHEDMLFITASDLWMSACSYVSVIREIVTPYEELGYDSFVWKIQSAARFYVDGSGARSLGVYVRAEGYGRTGSVDTLLVSGAHYEYAATGFSAGATEVTASLVTPASTVCSPIPATVTVRRVV